MAKTILGFKPDSFANNTVPVSFYSMNKAMTFVFVYQDIAIAFIGPYITLGVKPYSSKTLIASSLCRNSTNSRAASFLGEAATIPTG